MEYIKLYQQELNNKSNTFMELNHNFNKLNQMITCNSSEYHVSISKKNTDKMNDDIILNDVNNNKKKNNKIYGHDDKSGSNYLTFVPAASFDPSKKLLTRSSLCLKNSKNHHYSHCDRCCEEKYNQQEYHQLPNNNNNSNQLTDKEEIRARLKHDDRYSALIRQRKRAVFTHNFQKEGNYKIEQNIDDKEKKGLTNDLRQYHFPCVEKLVKMYTKLLQDKKSEFQTMSAITDKTKRDDSDHPELNRRNSPISDEGCAIGQSPYSSDYDDNEVSTSPLITIGCYEYHNIQKGKEKVMRSSSSDSALGLDDEIFGGASEISNEIQQHNPRRRVTLTVTDIPLRPALLPLAEPTQLPDSPTTVDVQPQPLSTNNSTARGAGSPLIAAGAVAATTLITQTAIPSKVILEERIVEIPDDKFHLLSNSRRESAQSCMSDYNSSEYGGVRYVRTPSVVVSDYSDDVMCGITLEEIEYFRAHRLRRRSSAETQATEKDDAISDVSAASSCSNLYYCGSTISALDGSDCYMNGIRMSMDRKISDCSTCSTVSGDGDGDVDESYIIQEYDHVQDNQQQKQQPDIKKPKKVGIKSSKEI